MARRLLFTGADPTDQRHYELAHVILLTSRLPLSPADHNRLGDLQDAWEAIGTEHPAEFVVDDRQFSAKRFQLASDAPTKSLVLEDAAHELLLRLCKEAALSGHVARPRRALVTFLDGAERGKLSGDGFMSATPQATS